MDGEDEESADREERAEGQKSTVRTTNEGEVHTLRREQTDYSSDTQWRGKGRTDSSHYRSEDELLMTAQLSSPKRCKNLKVERHGEKPQERRRSRTRNTFSKTV
jgi:hypothetical protein